MSFNINSSPNPDPKLRRIRVIRKRSVQELPSDTIYGIQVTHDVAKQFENVYFRMMIVDNALVFASGACPISKREGDVISNQKGFAYSH